MGSVILCINSAIDNLYVHIFLIIPIRKTFWIYGSPNFKGVSFCSNLDLTTILHTMADTEKPPVAEALEKKAPSSAEADLTKYKVREAII